MSGFTYDCFVAELRCPKCGEVCPADDSSGMQTAVRAQPELAWLGVGSPLSIQPDELGERGYIPVQAHGEPTRLLQQWSCPSCGSLNWAEITVRGGRIDSISATSLDKAALARAHFIDSEAKGVAAALADRTFGDVATSEVVGLLKQFL